MWVCRRKLQGNVKTVRRNKKSVFPYSVKHGTTRALILSLVSIKGQKFLDLIKFVLTFQHFQQLQMFTYANVFVMQKFYTFTNGKRQLLSIISQSPCEWVHKKKKSLFRFTESEKSHNVHVSACHLLGCLRGCCYTRMIHWTFSEYTHTIPVVLTHIMCGKHYKNKSCVCWVCKNGHPETDSKPQVLPSVRPVSC